MSHPPVIKICEWGPWGSIAGENFLRIFEDPFYSADLWGSLFKILKDLQNSCQDPQGSHKDLWGSLKVFASILKIFVGIFQIFVQSLKIFGKILTDLSHILTTLCKILGDLFRSSQIFVILSSQIFVRSSHIYVWKFFHGWIMAV